MRPDEEDIRQPRGWPPAAFEQPEAGTALVGPDGMEWLPGKRREGRASEDRSGLLSLRRSGGLACPIDPHDRTPHCSARSACCDLERLFRSWARAPMENRIE